MDHLRAQAFQASLEEQRWAAQRQERIDRRDAVWEQRRLRGSPVPGERNGWLG